MGNHRDVFPIDMNVGNNNKGGLTKELDQRRLAQRWERRSCNAKILRLRRRSLQLPERRDGTVSTVNSYQALQLAGTSIRQFQRQSNTRFVGAGEAKNLRGWVTCDS